MPKINQSTLIKPCEPIFSNLYICFLLKREKGNTIAKENAESYTAAEFYQINQRY